MQSVENSSIIFLLFFGIFICFLSGQKNIDEMNFAFKTQPSKIY
jgi:hypothetical protein